MLKSLKISVAVIALLLLVVSCKSSKDKTVVKVGKNVVKVSDFKSKLQEASYYYNADFVASEQGRKQVLDGVIKEAVMVEVAKDKGLNKSDEYLAQLRNFENQALITSLIQELRKKELNVTEEDVQKAYDDDKAYYEKPYQIKVAHILVSDKKQAEDLLKKIKDGEDFATLAKDNSMDQSSALNGGEMNWFGKNDMVKEFEDEAFKLKNNGDVSGVVQTQFGYHLIKKLDQRDADPISFDSVKTKIRRMLEKQRFDSWYNSVSAKKRVKINQAVIKDIKLD